MLRVHDVRGAGLTSFSYLPPGVYCGTAGTCSVSRIIPLFGDTPVSATFNFGGLQPDIFGSDIRYPDHEVFHKWDSIIHYNCDGDIYPFGKDFKRIYPDTATAIINNGYQHQYANLFVGYQQNAFTALDAYGYREFREYYKRQRFAGYYTLSRYYHAIGGDPNVAFIYTANVQIYTYNGKLSMSPYKDLPISDVNVSIWGYKWVKTSTGVRQFNLNLPAPLRTPIKVYISAQELDQSVYHIRRQVDELIDLYGKDLTPPSRPTRTLTFQNVPGVAVVPRSPNFEAIFAKNRRNTNWRQLAGQAYQTLGMSDINGIAFAGDLAEAGSMCTSFAKTLKSIPSGKVKAAASAWLAVHYGFKLMLLDILKLRETLEKESLRNSRKSKCQAVTEWTYEDIHFAARYQVFYNQYGKLISELDRLRDLTDFELTGENLWDMVPFSFVIDWFIGIGDVLQSLDTYAKLIQQHECIAAGRSVKGVTMAKPSQLGLEDSIPSTGVKLTCYLRRYERSLVPPSLIPQVTVNPFNHSVEGAALIISRK